jgi:hypothetical protein
MVSEPSCKKACEEKVSFHFSLPFYNQSSNNRHIEIYTEDSGGWGLLYPEHIFQEHKW